MHAGCSAIGHSVLASIGVLLYNFVSLAGELNKNDNHSGVGCQRLQKEGEVAEEIHD